MHRFSPNLLAGLFLATVLSAWGTSLDPDTVLLWSFDDSEYPHATVTDAGPYGCDLTLMDGKLVPGRFGNALATEPGPGQAVAFAGFIGDHPSSREERMPDGEPSGLWGSTIVPEAMVRVLAEGDWTLEFWFQARGVSQGVATLLDSGDGLKPGFTISADLNRQGFLLVNAYAGLKTFAPAELKALLDKRWHHVAFTWNRGGGGQLRQYVDGRPQQTAATSRLKPEPLPAMVIPESRDHPWPGFSKTNTVDWRVAHRFNVALGRTRRGQESLNCLLDELRLSAVVKYSDNFTPPGSFTRNYGTLAPIRAEANGPIPLFGKGHTGTNGVLPLGSRKHVFIDDALCERTDNLRLRCHPPMGREALSIEVEKSSWRPSVMDVGGKVYLYIPEGYNSEKGRVHLRISEDGTRFHSPDQPNPGEAGFPEHDCVIVDTPLYGNFFEDLNPRANAWERYKMTAWVANRGIYVYTSPDGIRWFRNETSMLPLLSGGDAETYWDDQAGHYVSFLKRDVSFNTAEAPRCNGRVGVRFASGDILKPWPFRKLAHPYFEGAPFPAVTGEGEVIIDADKNGEVYRTRAIKYPWAPDVHLAFVWRFSSSDQRRRVDLGVSRDGVHWRFFADETWYVQPGAGEEEALSMYGLIRRGDELWQYYDFGGAHGGGAQPRRYARLRQRLDGFVSLSADERPGWFVTHPFTFSGELTLNATVRGRLRVEVQDEFGRPLPGLGLEDCTPVVGDSTALKVRWAEPETLARAAKKPIKLKMELCDADLYALKFSQ